jgi:hypothetical protein
MLLGFSTWPSSRFLTPHTRFATKKVGHVGQNQTEQRRRRVAEEVVMARIAGLEKNEAPWHLRWFYNMTRKMFGKDLTPAKIQMKVPAIFWGAIGMEAALSKKRRVSLRLTQLAKVRTAYRIGCPF